MRCASSLSVDVPPSSGRTNTATELADPLTELNDRSRAAYRRAREGALARTGPVVLVQGDDLVLKYGQQRLVTRTTPDEYHVLKTVRQRLDHRGDVRLWLRREVE
jgi:hypothetical protein